MVNTGEQVTSPSGHASTQLPAFSPYSVDLTFLETVSLPGNNLVKYQEITEEAYVGLDPGVGQVCISVA